MENFKENKPSYNIHYREYMASKILNRETLEKRWRDIGYTPPKNFKPKPLLPIITPQLKLWI